MTPTQLRHGIAVLFQHNLLFWRSDEWTKVPIYEANIARAYNLVRTGKILEMVESSMGPPAKDVMQNLFILGQTRLGDLVDAYQGNIDSVANAAGAADVFADEEEAKPETNGGDGPVPNGTNGTNGESSHPKRRDDLVIKSTAHLNSVICNLVKADLVEVLHRRTFQSPEDTYKEICDEVEKKHFPLGVKGGKGKQEYEDRVAEYLRKVRGDSKTLKRRLEQNGTGSAKRRKLFNGHGTNGAHEEESHDMDPHLDVRLPDPRRRRRKNWRGMRLT